MKRAICLVVLAAALASGIAIATPLAATVDELGDCNGDGVVTVDELVLGVRIGLGEAEVRACPELDANEDGAVTVDELVQAVLRALEAPPPLALAFVTTTDFQTGSFATIATTAPFRVDPSRPQRRLGADPVARVFGRRVFVINRFGADNVQILDADRDFATVAQCSTGNGSNPQDLAFRDGRTGYVTLLARPYLLRVGLRPRPDCADFIQQEIDLRAYADRDGSPEASQSTVVGGFLYVALQRLENFTPVQPGLLLRIDPATDTVVGALQLMSANPFGMTQGLLTRGNRMYVVEVGQFGVNDGGVEAIDLDSFDSLGWVVREDALGGDITDIVLVSESLAYAIVSLPNFSTALMAFDPRTGQKLRTVLRQDGLSDIELDTRGQLFVVERNIHNPGVRVLRAADGVELTPGPLPTGLPPFDLVFLE